MALRKDSDYNIAGTIIDTMRFKGIDLTQVDPLDKDITAAATTIRDYVLASVDVKASNILVVDKLAPVDTGVRGNLAFPFDTIGKALTASVSGDEIWILNSNGTAYDEANTINAKDLVIRGFGRPSLTSSTGATLQVTGGASCRILDLNITSTATGAGTCPIQIIQVGGGSAKTRVQGCNIYALGDSCVTAESAYFYDCYMESAGNQHLLNSNGNVVVENCYLYQPDTASWSAVNAILQQFTFINNWFEGGLLGVGGGGSSQIFIRDSKFKGTNGNCINTNGSFHGERNVFYPTNLVSAIRIGLAVSTQSVIKDNIFPRNTTNAVTFNAGVPAGADKIITSGNIHLSGTNLVDPTYAASHTSVGDIPLSLVGTSFWDDFALVKAYFQNRQ